MYSIFIKFCLHPDVPLLSRPPDPDAFKV